MKKFVPYYGGYGGKMSSGAGWGGEKPKKVVKIGGMVLKKKKLSVKKDPMGILKRGMQGAKK